MRYCICQSWPHPRHSDGPERVAVNPTWRAASFHTFTCIASLPPRISYFADYPKGRRGRLVAKLRQPRCVLRNWRSWPNSQQAEVAGFARIRGNFSSRRSRIRKNSGELLGTQTGGRSSPKRCRTGCGISGAIECRPARSVANSPFNRHLQANLASAVQKNWNASITGIENPRLSPLGRIQHLTKTVCFSQ